MNAETKKFILEHAEDDIHQLSLDSHRFPQINMPLVIRQINGRRNIKPKVPLFYQQDAILYPAKLSLEQSSSETTALYKSYLCKGDTLVDLTGGFGVDCCFMSIHFQDVTYVEQQEELCQLAKHNFNVLNKNHIRVINDKAENYLTAMKSVDWIYLDPARRNNSGKKLVLLSDCDPDINVLHNLLIEKAKHVLIKLSPMMDISAAIKDLPLTSEIHVLSVDNECKEVLLILNRLSSEKKIIKTINFNKINHSQTFEFEIDEERMAQSTFSSSTETYLYEPNAAILKSGAFKIIGERFGLKKLHKHTHLYTSNDLKSDFPGRIFQITKMWGSSKEEVKEEIKRLPKANITTRNYPLNADDLRKKLKMKSGGDIYLFACTIHDEKKVILECEKVLKTQKLEN